MIEAIKKVLSEYNLTYIHIEDASILNIYNLYVNNILFEPVTHCELLYMGVYYKTIKNYIEMEKYYLMAIKKGNQDAMYNLAVYYKNIKNYIEMEKYYLMAIEKGNDKAMNNLAVYYEEIKNDIEMEKYYLMAIEKGNRDAMNNLAYYYKNNQYELKLLNLYILKNHNRDEIITLFNKISSSLDLNDKELFLKLLTEYQFENTDKLCVLLALLVNTLKNNIDIIDLHFIYSIHGKGFEDAKHDYFNRCLGY